MGLYSTYMEELSCILVEISFKGEGMLGDNEDKIEICVVAFSLWSIPARVAARIIAIQTYKLPAACQWFA